MIAATADAPGNNSAQNRVTGEIERVSVASDGSDGRLWSREPSISADGRYVAFHSKAWNFVPDVLRGGAARSGPE